MREKQRIKRILNLIENIWENNQNMRFGQLLINYGIIPDNLYTWLRDDDLLEETLERSLKGGKYDNKRKGRSNE